MVARDMSGRRMRRSEPQPMKAVVSDFMHSSGLARQLKNPALFAAWQRIVPEHFRPFTRVAGIKNKVVIIEVSSAAVMQELAQFREEYLRAALIQALGGTHVAGLRFALADFGRIDERNKV